MMSEKMKSAVSMIAALACLVIVAGIAVGLTVSKKPGDVFPIVLQNQQTLQEINATVTRQNGKIAKQAEQINALKKRVDNWK